MSSSYILWGAPRSRSARIAWLLEELQVDWTWRPISFRAGEHRSEAFLALNPAGKVPVLQHGETLVLGTLQFVIGRRDAFEGFQDLGLELHFHLRERNTRFAIFVVLVAFLTALVFFVADFWLGFFFSGFGFLRFDFLYDLFLVFCVEVDIVLQHAFIWLVATIGGVEVDDVAQ